MYKVETQFGNYNVRLVKKNYVNNGNLAIRMIDEDEFPFATLTVNLGGKLADDVAYVDVNNCPWAEDFIEGNNLGVPTGMIGMSGWCFYPQYKFDLSKIA